MPVCEPESERAPATSADSGDERERVQSEPGSLERWFGKVDVTLLALELDDMREFAHLRGGDPRESRLGRGTLKLTCDGGSWVGPMMTERRKIVHNGEAG